MLSYYKQNHKVLVMPVRTRAETGRQLSRLRREYELTQSQLATVAGVSQAMISQVEQGKRELPLRAFERIVQHLGLDGASLVSQANPAFAMEALSNAWEAYSGARRAYLDLAKTVIQRSDVFRNNWKERRQPLREALTDAELGQLDNLVSQKFRNFIKQNTPPPTDTHEAYRSLPGGGIPEQGTLHRVLELCSIVGRLSDSDLQLLITLARRLSSRDEPHAPPVQAKRHSHKEQCNGQT